MQERPRSGTSRWRHRYARHAPPHLIISSFQSRTKGVGIRLSTVTVFRLIFLSFSCLFFFIFIFFIVTHRKGTRYILANVTFTQDGRMAGRLEDLSKRDTFEQTNWIGRYAFRYWRRLETLNFLIDRRDQWY